MAKRGQNCSAGCRTLDHRTWGECIREKNALIAESGVGGGDCSAQKKWDRELEAYRDARRQGIQPEGTSMAHIHQALDASDRAGAAYGRDFAVATPVEAS